MSVEAVSQERVGELIDAYGADPARWPERERRPAQALLMQSVFLRERQSQARALDRLLGTGDVAPPDDELMAAVLAARPRQAKSFWRLPGACLWPEEGYWAPAGALAASALLGIYIGAAGALTAMSDESGTQSALISLAVADTAIEENWNE